MRTHRSGRRAVGALGRRPRSARVAGHVGRPRGRRRRRETLLLVRRLRRRLVGRRRVRKGGLLQCSGQGSSLVLKSHLIVQGLNQLISSVWNFMRIRRPKRHRVRA
jgi:hypothetical protein